MVVMSAKKICWSQQKCPNNGVQSQGFHRKIYECFYIHHYFNLSTGFHINIYECFYIYHYSNLSTQVKESKTRNYNLKEYTCMAISGSSQEDLAIRWNPRRVLCETCVKQGTYERFFSSLMSKSMILLVASCRLLISHAETFLIVFIIQQKKAHWITLRLEISYSSRKRSACAWMSSTTSLNVCCNVLISIFDTNQRCCAITFLSCNIQKWIYCRQDTKTSLSLQSQWILFVRCFFTQYLCKGFL